MSRQSGAIHSTLTWELAGPESRGDGTSAFGNLPRNPAIMRYF